jgi:SAM-dependent methyltransferase
VSRALRAAAKFLANTAASAAGPYRRKRFKEYCEMRFWRGVVTPILRDPAEMERERAHYEYFFTEYFGLTREDYRDKAVLDIGCGPMGSLEWADIARERVGLDPLAGHYRNLVGRAHAMTYVAAPSESIPYENGHFDVATSFNSLDHVDDVQQTVAEMKRVVSAHGRVLLIVEIGHAPTSTEPHCLDRTLIERFAPEFTTFGSTVFGVRADHNVYGSILDDTPYTEGRPGILCARMERTRADGA